MEQWEQWFREKQVERTIGSLKKNNFEAVYVPDSKAAFEEVMKRIPDGATVGIGGSVTLAQMGVDLLTISKLQPGQIVKKLSQKGWRVNNMERLSCIRLVLMPQITKKIIDEFIPVLKKTCEEVGEF